MQDNYVVTVNAINAIMHEKGIDLADVIRIMLNIIVSSIVEHGEKEMREHDINVIKDYIDRLVNVYNENP